MPTVITEGAMAARGFGFGASGAGAANYIEDVFSTYLYDGTGATQTITNGIDLSTKGGLVWMKSRSAATDHALYDTARGATFDLVSNTTAAQTTQATGLTAFGTTGFSIGALAKINTSAATYVSWSFREQAKFFDVVTYTGTGSNTTIAHNLGSTPGCIIVKRTDTTSDWQVYHSGLTSAAYSIQLNLTSAQASATTVWNSTAPTSSVFSVGTSTDVNASGGTYVAYLFASNAGGFGSAGTDNVISCGSFTVSSGTGSTDVNLGYEPQWLLAKPSTDPGYATNWNLYDTMRGWVNTTNAGNVNARLSPNTATAETSDKLLQPTATGFTMLNSNVYPGVPITYIYIAIRRGPMKTPTVGTSVYNAILRTGTGADVTVTGIGFTPDLLVDCNTDATAVEPFRFWFDRLRGLRFIASNNTLAEAGSTNSVTGFDVMNAIKLGTSERTNFSALPYINWFFRRAPGFFDEMCYTGTGANTTQTHNLGVVPELIIVKGRSGATAWQVYSSALANTEYLVLNTTAAKATGATRWNSTTPTSTLFSLGTATEVNTSAETYVAYLFATCPGVSKVGSYSGTGATQTINCGFTGGARFALIKRTDSTGDWYVWDTARGMVSGTDPYLLLNSTAAEVNANSIYTATTGFQIVSTAAGINASGGTYIFLAIA